MKACGRARMSTGSLTKAARCLEMLGNHSPMDIIVYGGRCRHIWMIYLNPGVGRTTRRVLTLVFLAAAIPRQSHGMITGGEMQFGRSMFGHNFRLQRHTPNRHQLWRDVPSGGIHTYLPDVLHSKHLGTDASFYGGAVDLLTHYRFAWLTPRQSQSCM